MLIYNSYTYQKYDFQFIDTNLILPFELNHPNLLDLVGKNSKEM